MRRFLLPVALATTLVLAGCGPTAPPVAEEPPAPSDPPSASATPEPDPPSDVLFTITTQTPDTSGAMIEVTLTGHAPQDWDAPGRDDVKKAFINGCNALGGGTVSQADDPLNETTLDQYGSTLMVLELESAPAGRTLKTPFHVLFSNPFYYSVAAGDGLVNKDTDYCYGNYQLTTSGSASAVTNYETGNPTPDLKQWTVGRYGFFAEKGAPFGDCVVKLTPLAESLGVLDVEGWGTPFITEQECSVGILQNEG